FQMPGVGGRIAQPEHTYRLVTEASRAGGATRYWITSLVDRPIHEILSLVRHTARTESVVKVLEDHFGILDFEGRSFPGWHHHMTMVSAAYAYRRLFQTGSAYRVAGADAALEEAQ